MRKGTYLLFLTFGGPRKTGVGSLGQLEICAGEYCYVGSAMNGMDGRIRRHFSKDKKMHWHIDRLTVSADVMEAYVPLTHIEECTLSAIAEGCGCIPVFKGFGCSDCACATHIFFVTEGSKQKLTAAAGARPFLL